MLPRLPHSCLAASGKRCWPGAEAFLRTSGGRCRGHAVDGSASSCGPEWDPLTGDVESWQVAIVPILSVSIQWFIGVRITTRNRRDVNHHRSSSRQHQRLRSMRVARRSLSPRFLARNRRGQFELISCLEAPSGLASRPISSTPVWSNPMRLHRSAAGRSLRRGGSPLEEQQALEPDRANLKHEPMAILRPTRKLRTALPVTSDLSTPSDTALGDQYVN